MNRKKILIIYNDSFPHATSNVQEDVFIKRITLQNYSTHSNELRGMNFIIVILDGVSVADLRRYPRSWNMLTNAMISYGSSFMTVKECESIGYFDSAKNSPISVELPE